MTPRARAVSAQTAILVDNYDEAASSGLQARGQQPQHLPLIADEPEKLSQAFGSVQVPGFTAARFAMAYENGEAIALCRNLKRPLAALWLQICHFD